jgi:hypothetical protein
MAFLQQGSSAQVAIAAGESIAVGAVRGATANVTYPVGYPKGPSETVVNGTETFGPFVTATTVTVYAAQGTAEYVTGANPVCTDVPIAAYTWATKPSAVTAGAGAEILITDVPASGRTRFWSDGTRWNRHELTMLAGSAVAASATTVAADTVKASFTLPGGLLGPNGWLEVRFRTANVGANAHLVKVFLGAGQLFGLGPTSTYVGGTARISNRNSQSSQIGTPLNLSTPDASGGNTLLTATIDTSVDQTVTVTLNAAGGDSMVLEEWDAWFVSRS